MDLEGLRHLVAIADAGSIQGGARALPAARATVRRRLEQAEREVGAALFRRSGKVLVPTAAGEVLVSRAREMVSEAATLVRTAALLAAQPEGRLRCVLPTGPHPGLVNIAVGFLRATVPGLTVELRCDTRPLAALLDTTDLVFRFEDDPVPDAWAIVHEIRMRQRLVASASYLDAHPPIERPEDLHDHPLLFHHFGPDPPAERLPRLDGGAVSVRPAVVSNDIHLVHWLAEAGSGVAWVPDPGLPAIGPSSAPMRGVLEHLIGRSCSMRLLSPRALANAPHLAPILATLRAHVLAR